MALWPMDAVGATFATGTFLDQTASRSLGGSGVLYAEDAVFGLTASRPMSASGGQFASGAFNRLAASREMTNALSAYSRQSFVSLSSFRALAVAVARYASGGFTRRGASRPIGLGYSLFVAGPPVPPRPSDTTPPVVGNYNPVPGTPLSKTMPVSFDVTDDSGAFRVIFVVAFFPSTGATEVIHDGDRFRGAYAATSARKTITNGFRYTVLPLNGWPAAPTIQTFAIDLAGNAIN
jgi:hypothetical protein